MSVFENKAKDLFQRIVEDKTKNYLNQPIPCNLDERVRALVELFVSASTQERKMMLSMDTRRISGALLGFAERMAAAGVREISPARLLDGLVALIIENYSTDWRDVIIRMAPLYHAAVRIGVDAEELFDEAASYSENEVAGNLSAFPRRSPENRSLQAFGYKAVVEPDGIRYRWA
jgi:hypothetical protein